MPTSIVQGHPYGLSESQGTMGQRAGLPNGQQTTDIPLSRTLDLLPHQLEEGGWCQVKIHANRLYVSLPLQIDCGLVIRRCSGSFTGMSKPLLAWLVGRWSFSVYVLTFNWSIQVQPSPWPEPNYTSIGYWVQ